MGEAAGERRGCAGERDARWLRSIRAISLAELAALISSPAKDLTAITRGAAVVSARAEPRVTLAASDP
jgi:hypothetical protein